MEAVESADWVLPRHRVHQIRGRQSRYCTVICVINEGQRILRQLSRMASIDVPDIIIGDGGSSDGSTDVPLLADHGVRTLLVKEDTGGLSAQMRMAWAYALKEGYEGIITLDGNDKDDVSAIPSFSRELDGGWDFVQGSRFLPGGGAVRTPRTRSVAIRAIHAPIVSAASGFQYTDTTNGFRAHSRKLLLHPGLKPFRPVFERYELLAYVSVRAPRLGLRVEEIPVTRTYPTEGIPTKISPLKGNIDLLRVLYRAARHRLDP